MSMELSRNRILIKNILNRIRGTDIVMNKVISWQFGEIMRCFDIFSRKRISYCSSLVYLMNWIIDGFVMSRYWLRNSIPPLMYFWEVDYRGDIMGNFWEEMDRFFIFLVIFGKKISRSRVTVENNCVVC